MSLQNVLLNPIQLWVSLQSSTIPKSEGEANIESFGATGIQIEVNFLLIYIHVTKVWALNFELIENNSTFKMTEATPSDIHNILQLIIKVKP